MNGIRTIGLPNMHAEAGEKRFFRPEFIWFLTNLGFTVYLERGYGSRLGCSFEAFASKGNNTVFECDRDTAFRQEYVLILRCPKEEEFVHMRPGSCLISMLHYPTRAGRVQDLQSRGLNAISLDSIVNDRGYRLVEDLRGVAWNGLSVAFDELQKQMQDFQILEKKPVRVLILGTGKVGKHAAEAASKLGDTNRFHHHIAYGKPGALAIMAGSAVTKDEVLMKSLLAEADILVDATQRKDSSKPVIPNRWIQWLPLHAIITDLAVDPYLLEDTPPTVRGIEGIPQGNLDTYVFTPDDPAWTATIPSSIPCIHRRVVVTCYSWPGIRPKECMEQYGEQLMPLMEVLAERGYHGLSPKGSYFERALWRGTLGAFLGTYSPNEVGQSVTGYSLQYSR